MYKEIKAVREPPSGWNATGEQESGTAREKVKYSHKAK
jgi:hypothetical protein